MLIKLRREDFPSEPDWWAAGSGLSFAENLADILRFGHHAVQAKPGLLLLLSEIKALSLGQQKALSYAAVVNQDPALFGEAVDPLLIIGPNATTAPVAGQRQVDWLRLANPNQPLPRAVLLAENLDDARFYLWLARAWAARLRPASLRAGDEVSLVPQGGGGDTTVRELVAIARQGNPVLAIADSDRDGPSLHKGDTARKLLKEARRLVKSGPAHNHRVALTRARALEHLIPVDIIREAARTSAWVKPMIARGFFARPEVDPALCYLPINKERGEDALLAGASGDALAYRSTAIQRMRSLDATAPTDATTPLVYNVGKLPGPAVDLLEKKLKQQSKADVAAWLAARLPDHDLALIEPAQLAWSWGLSIPARIRSADGPERWADEAGS